LTVIAGAALAAPLLGRWPPQHVIAAGLAAIAGFNTGLIITVSSAWLLPLCMAVGGLGIGLSSVAATGLGTSVPVPARGAASGIVNTAAQLGTAVGIAVVLLVATVTTGAPAAGTPVPTPGWTVAAPTSLAGAVAYAVLGRRGTLTAPTRQISAAPGDQR
jgi:hypothetical protein